MHHTERYYNRLLLCELTSQDPSDEPAADLLARIRATRPTTAHRVGKAQRAHAEPKTPRTNHPMPAARPREARPAGGR